MYIQGKKIDPTACTTQQLISQIRLAPTALEKAVPSVSPHQLPRNIFDLLLEVRGDLYRDCDMPDEEPMFLEAAQKNLDKAFETLETMSFESEQEEATQWALLMLETGRLLVEFGNVDPAKRYLQRARQNFQRLNDPSLYEESLREMTNWSVRKNLPAEKLHPYSYLHNRLKEGTLNPHAHYVGQAQIGYSQSAPMATEAVRDCVCGILHHPDSKFSALFHQDYAQAAPLDAIIARFPEGRIEAHLIGGIRGYETSEHNLDFLIKELAQHEQIELISARVQESELEHISAICFDPKTNQLSQEIAGLRPATQPAYEGSILLNNRFEMAEAFDLTQSPHHYSPFMSMDALAELDHIRQEFNLDSLDQYNFDLSIKKAAQHTGMVALPLLVGWAIEEQAFLNDWHKQAFDMLDHLQEVRHTAGLCALSPDQLRQTDSWLKTQPMHVGSTTDNAELIAYLEAAFQQEVLDLSALFQQPLPEQLDQPAWKRARLQPLVDNIATPALSSLQPKASANLKPALKTAPKLHKAKSNMFRFG